MIQRIQSLLLLIATICFVVACFMPVAHIITSEAYYVLTSWSVRENIPDGAIIHPTYFIGLLQALLAVLSFVTIFLYKKRPLQSKMCMLAILVNFILLVLMLWVYPDKMLPQISLLAGGELKYTPWAILSILPLACFYLGNKFIIKDEKMVRAADRLR
jgi:hypothetical protein